MEKGKGACVRGLQRVTSDQFDARDPTRRALGSPAYMKSIGVIELRSEIQLAKSQSKDVCRREIHTMSVCHEEMQGN